VKAATLGLAGSIALIPLLGQLVVLDPTRPPMPILLPRGAALLVALLFALALLAVVPATLRSLRRDGLTFVLIGSGAATTLAGITGFDPVTGVGLGLFVFLIGGAGLALAREADAAVTRLIVRTFLWSATAAAALALVMVLVRRPVALFAFANGRAVGTFLNPNELAGYALVGLGIALPLAIGSRGRDRLAVACAVLLAVALAATFSRWGAFSAVCGIATYGLLARQRRLLVAALLIGLAGLTLDATLGSLHHNPRDTAVRLSAWHAGWTTFTRFPLLGVGPLAYGKTYAVLRPPDAPGPQTPVAFDPHSLPLAYAAEGGLVALVMLVVGPALLVRRVVRAAAVAPALPRAFGFGLVAGFVAFLVHCGLNTISIFFPLYLQVVPLALAVVRTDAL